ncbi:DUF2809 domain-containing protein [Frondihabitans peucedani]|uniref:DUF2809 domain-containing protein n=1 Tax=Frondihabitans peucedani TaxID=598626 RepID=A0ABP8E168_9MICO
MSTAIDRATAPERSRSRDRAALAGTAAAVVAAGVAVKLGVPGLAGDIAGSALYTGLLFVLGAFVAPRARGAVLAAAAFGISAAVEILQLTPLPAAVDAVVPAAHWVLGSTFAATDLVGYAVGAALALGADVVVARARLHSRRHRRHGTRRPARHG